MILADPSALMRYSVCGTYTQTTQPARLCLRITSPGDVSVVQRIDVDFNKCYTPHLLGE